MRKLGRFIVDTHVHAQRHAAGPELRKLGVENPKQAKYDDLSQVMPKLITYDNSPRLLYDMECYGVDMCILLPAFGMSNELNMQLVEKYPDKFVAVCSAKKTADRVRAGEIEWSIEEAAKEVDELLSTGKFIGIGEGMPGRRQRFRFDHRERMDEMRVIMQVARKYKVPSRFHTGTTMGYTGALGYYETMRPLWAHDIAAEFPDVPLILDHGGIQGGWWKHFYEEALHVAASHDNVYLETGMYWAELYQKPLLDPNIGPEKLIWGTDWGASIPMHTQVGHTPGAYFVQTRKQGVVRHQVDYWGWSMRQLMKLDISQDDLNLILGGNACRIFNIKPPLTRLFKFVN